MSAAQPAENDARAMQSLASSQDFMRNGRTAHPRKWSKKKQPNKKKKEKALKKRKAAPALKPKESRKTIECSTCSTQKSTCNYFSAESVDEFMSLSALPIGGPVIFTNCVCEETTPSGICGSCAAVWIRNLRKFPDAECRTCAKIFLGKFSSDISRQLLQLFPDTTASVAATVTATGTGGDGVGGGGGGEATVHTTVSISADEDDESDQAKKMRREEHKQHTASKAVCKLSLSEADDSIVQHMAHMHRVRDHNCTEWCRCSDTHGAQHVRMKRVATFYLEPESAKVRVRGSGGKFQSFDHPTVCYHCMEPCELGVACPCAKPLHRTNPYYRDFSGTARDLSLTRNCDLDPSKVREFFKQLAALPHDGCICPCGQSLHRTVDCHEMTCPCGFHVCYFCGFARFIDSPHITLTSHYDFCAQYPCDVTLGYMQGYVKMQYPCKCNGHAKCHGSSKDCSEPTHRHWRELYHANRKAAWAAGFVLEVQKIPGLFEVAQEEFRKYPQFTDYMVK